MSNANAERPLLITGGAGFIGSCLVRQYLGQANSPVINVDKLTYAGHRESLHEVLENRFHRLIVGDICDASLMRQVLADHRPRGVIHLAAESHVDRSITSPSQFAETNVLGTTVLLDCVTEYWRPLNERNQRDFRFVYVSSDEVFGAASRDERFNEESSLAPNSPYSASKASGELMLRAFAHTYGLPAIVVNPSNNYGPRQHPEKLIPRMILAASRNEKLPVYGDGRQERDWLHVDDCCTALRVILERGQPGERYLVGAGHPRQNIQVVAEICDLVDKFLGDNGQRRSLIAHVSDRPGHDRRYAVDPSLLVRELHWSPHVQFSAGLAQTVRWYLENSDWVSMVSSASTSPA